MTLQTAILAWLMALTPHHTDTETRPERLERMGVIAEAVATESEGNYTSAAAMVAILKHESWASQAVHSGKKRADGGKSVCLMMINRDGLRDRDRWDTLPGTDLAATRRCVGAGLMLWGRFWFCYRRAEPDLRWESMMSAYGTGAGCKIEATGRKKAATFRQALSFLYRHK